MFTERAASICILTPAEMCDHMIDALAELPVNINSTKHVLVAPKWADKLPLPPSTTWQLTMSGKNDTAATGKHLITRVEEDEALICHLEIRKAQ